MDQQRLTTILVLLLQLLVLPSEARRLKDSFSQCSPDDLLSDIEVQPPLAKHSKEFDPPTVIKVTDGVYVAVGYALANSILLEGTDGAVVVDVTESVESARTILAEFRKHSTKPITDIVFTHHHGDHVFGAEGFIEDAANPPNIWAHHIFSDLVRGDHIVGPKLFRGVAYQMGSRLGPKYIVNSGLGPRLHVDTSRAVASPLPNRFIYGDTEEVHLTVPGINVTFIHIPGETEDQLAVWLPDKGVLLPADDLYKTFPNLYAIRGTTPRNSMTWYDSLRRMRDLGAGYLVPSHTRPVVGHQRIHDTLTTYMAAVRYVHDQTVRYMNRGLHPDEVAARVRELPASLASLPHLQQFYGTTVWSSKGIYEHYVGWFSGDPVELLPLGPTERSMRMVDMVGVERLLAEAEAALKGGQLQWALEVVSHVWRVQPEVKAVVELRMEVLRALAARQTNPIARNFYMTTILDDHGLIDWTLDPTKLIETLPMTELLDLMRYKVKAEDVEGLDLTIVVRFADAREGHRLRIQYSVLDVERLGKAAGGVAGEEGITGEAAEVEREGGVTGGGPEAVSGSSSEETRISEEDEERWNIEGGAVAGEGGVAGGAGAEEGTGWGAERGAGETDGGEGGAAGREEGGGVTEAAAAAGAVAGEGGVTGGALEGEVTEEGPEAVTVSSEDRRISEEEEEDRWIKEEEGGSFDVKIVTTSVVWRELMSKKRSLQQSISSGDIRLVPEDGLPTLTRFLACFDTN